MLQDGGTSAVDNGSGSHCRGSAAVRGCVGGQGVREGAVVERDEGGDQGCCCCGTSKPLRRKTTASYFRGRGVFGGGGEVLVFVEKERMGCRDL